MRYAIVSDIHANYGALEAVDRVVRRIRAVDPDPEQAINYWFLGDLLGYGPQPIECIRWLQGQVEDENWIPGNHDLEVVNRIAARVTLDINRTELLPQGSSSSSEENGHALATWPLHAEILSRPENSGYLEWFRTQVNLKLQSHTPVVREIGDLVLIFAHGSASPTGRLTQYLRPWGHGMLMLQTDLQSLWHAYGGNGRTVCMLYGHTHFPAIARLKHDFSGISLSSIDYGKPIRLSRGCIAVNPGSIGKPHDGDPRASFALLDSEERTITFHRVAYDMEKVLEKMAGYPAGLKSVIETGNGGADMKYYEKEAYRSTQGSTLQNGTWVACKCGNPHWVPNRGSLKAISPRKRTSSRR